MCTYPLQPADVKGNSSQNILINISPIRHLHQGLAQNSLSKSILRLAADVLCKRFEQVHYFPSFEMVVDDLRDYRFYKPDLVHPSELAIEYIWEQLQASLFSKETQSVLVEVGQLQKRLHHRAMRPSADSYRSFVAKTEKMLNRIVLRYPSACWEEEHRLLREHKRRVVTKD